jgi:hypothetical protein
MPDHSALWFYPTALRADFLRDLEHAHSAGQIDADVLRALAGLAGPVADAVSCTLYRVQMADDAPLPGTLAGAWLLTDGTTQVYLHTCLYGLERFADRHALKARLRDMTGLAEGEFTQSRLEGPAFETRMGELYDSRLSSLSAFHEQWLQLPALTDDLENARARPGAEQQLTDYWDAEARPGQTRRQALAHRLRERFCRALIDAGHRGEIDPAWAQALPWQDAQTWQAVSVQDEKGAWRRLAGVWILQRPAAGTPAGPLLLWSTQGVQLFASRARLLAWLSDAAQLATLAPPVTARERSVFLAQAVSVRLDPVRGEPFTHAAQSLIALQQRQGVAALSQVDCTAMAIAKALDIRALIDPALSRFESPPKVPVPVAAHDSHQPPAQRAMAVMNQWRLIDDHLDTLTATATACLDRALASIDVNLARAGALTLEGATPSAESSALPDLVRALLKRVTGDLPADRFSHAQLPEALLDHLLEDAARRLRKDHSESLDRDLRASRFERIGLRKQALSLELLNDRGQLPIPAVQLDWLRQLLAAPDHDARLASALPLCDVHCLCLSTASDRPGVELADAFTLHLAQAPAGGVLFWSAVDGLQSFISRSALFTTLKANLVGDQAHRWLELLPPGERQRVAVHLGQSPAGSLYLSTHAVDEDFAEHLQHLARQYRLQEFDHAWTLGTFGHLGPAAFASLIDQAQRSPVMEDHLLGQVNALQTAELRANLPTWLKEADRSDIRDYADAIERIALSTLQTRDFRFGLDSPLAYATTRLRERFAQLQPVATPDPDAVRITLSRYVTSPTRPGEIPWALPAVAVRETDSLAAYALNHFNRFQDAHLEVHMSDGSAVPDWLVPLAVRKLVRELDLGSGYRDTLAVQLSRRRDDYPVRRDLFTRQAPAQLYEAALQAKISGELSATAFGYVEAVLSMPDAMARQPVQGQSVSLRPLALIPAAGMAPDRVNGLCLIGAATPGSGPVVLYAAACASFVFKEFASDAALLTAAQTRGALQTLIIERLDESARQRYRHGGLIEPHLPDSSISSFDIIWFPHPAPRLATQPWSGHAMHLLFEDTVELIQDMAKSQTVSSREADWASLKFLMGLAVDQALVLLPGRLAGLVGLWQGLGLLQASVTALRSRQWGESLGELAAALAALGSARRPNKTARPAEYVAGDPGLAQTLSTFEASAALADLYLDTAQNLYRNAAGSRTYGVLAGKVYQMRHDQGRTYLATDHELGPNVIQDSDSSWSLNRLWHLHYGKMCSTGGQLSPTTAAVGELIDVRASGMAAIRSLSMDKARRIGQAHAFAKRRLEVALDNLGAQSPTQPLHPSTVTILTEFFGTPVMAPKLVGKVREAIAALFTELLDASLSPWSSERFVYGINRPGMQESHVAMVAKEDPKRRIFLTELFFDLPARLRRHHGRLLEPFDLPAHIRSSALLHELSHLVSDTEDIAYLEPAAPYPDLIDTYDPLDPEFKTLIIELQQKALSVSTPRQQLFQRKIQGTWHDLSTLDPEATAKILTISGASSLDAARDLFYSDPDIRADIMLANADSVTMLALLLGREPFTVPSP